MSYKYPYQNRLYSGRNLSHATPIPLQKPFPRGITSNDIFKEGSSYMSNPTTFIKELSKL